MYENIKINSKDLPYLNLMEKMVSLSLMIVARFGVTVTSTLVFNISLSDNPMLSPITEYLILASTHCHLYISKHSITKKYIIITILINYIFFL